jgi:hypothetical protein
MQTSKLLYSYLILTGINVSLSSASEILHEVDKLGNVLSSTQLRAAISLGSPIYSDEMVILIDKRKAILEPYAPTNLWRKTFNGFKKADTVKFQGRNYSIAGLRNAKEQDKQAIRKKTIESLPHNAAFVSNTRGFLYVKGSLVDSDGYAQIQYGYVPGLLDHSGTPEYTFSVETELNFNDKGLYREFTKQISELNKYIAYDQQDREEEDPQTAQVWDKSKTPQNSFENLRAKAQVFIDDRLAGYINLRTDRIVLLMNYSTFKTDQERTMLRHFSNQVLEYRKYLIDSTFGLQSANEEDRFEEQLKSFQINCNLFSNPLGKFHKWFIKKDVKAPEYVFYQGWK